MSEQRPSADERDWPKKCPYCRTELQTASQGFNPAGEDDIAHGEMDEILAVDFCPNPDCPGEGRLTFLNHPKTTTWGCWPSGTDPGRERPTSFLRMRQPGASSNNRPLRR